MQFKAGKHFGQFIKPINIKVLATSLVKQVSGIFSYNNFSIGFICFNELSSYLKAVKKFDELTIKFLLDYFFEGKTELSLTKFLNICKRLVMREVKAESVASVLSRVKYNFVSRQILIDDI